MNIIKAIEVVKQAQQKVYHPKYTIDGDIVVFSSVSEDGVLKGNSLTLEHITPELLNGWCIYNVIDNDTPLNKDEKKYFDYCLKKMMTNILERREVDCFYSIDSRYAGYVKVFRRLLEVKEYGLKAILLLWETLNQGVARNNIPCLEALNTLYRVFPWQAESSFNDMCEDSVLSINDWLIENYKEEMIVNFLNQRGK